MIETAVGRNLNNRQLVFTPGIFATEYQMQLPGGVKDGFSQQYGSDNVIVFNSPISTEEPSIGRAETIRAIVNDRAKTGLTWAMHSLGTAEVDAFDPQSPSARLVLFGPSGVAPGFKEKILYLGRYVRDALPIGRGIHSLSAFPPEGITTAELTGVLGKYSQMNKGFETVALEGIQGNRERLTDTQKETLSQTDAALKKAIDAGRRRKAKRIIKRRGSRRVVGKPLAEFYKGRPKGEKEGIPHIGGRKGLRILRRAISTEPMQEIQRFLEAGHQVDCFVAEYDITPTEWLARIYPTPKAAREHIKVIPGMAHATIIFQPASYGELVARGDKTPDAIMAS